MKKIISICFILLAVNLLGKEWESYWITAWENCHEEDYLSAEHNFDISIQLLENENDIDHPSIYLDRASLNLQLNKYQEALYDINQALLSEKLTHKERITAVKMRVKTKAILKPSDVDKEDIEFLVKNCEIQIENTENHLIIRNFPNCEKFKESIMNFFVDSGICEDKKSIKIHSSNLCIINKTMQKKNPIHESIFQSSGSPSKQLGRDIRLIEGCKLWCDDNTQAAIAWCINYPELCVVRACNSAVFEIQNNCHACCQNGFSEDRCAAPFGDIVGVMQKYLKSSCGCGCK